MDIKQSDIIRGNMTYLSESLIVDESLFHELLMNGILTTYEHEQLKTQDTKYLLMLLISKLDSETFSIHDMFSAFERSGQSQIVEKLKKWIGGNENLSQ